MAFEHNDIATKNRLMSGLGEELMGFEHNDIVTVDVMNAAIAEGGGGGDYPKFNVTLTGDSGAFYLYPGPNDDGNYTCVFLVDSAFNTSGVGVATDESATYSLLSFGDSATLSPGNTIKSVSGDAVYDSDTGLITVTGDCTITGYMDD